MLASKPKTIVNKPITSLLLSPEASQPISLTDLSHAHTPTRTHTHTPTRTRLRTYTRTRKHTSSLPASKPSSQLLFQELGAYFDGRIFGERL